MKIRRYAVKKKKARIEIIPMIDTMFFLLVFFMVATMSMTVMRGMPVDLPKSEAAKNSKADEKRSVTVAKDGALFLDKERVGTQTLFKRLKADFEANPEALVIINADEEVSHGRVVEVMDTVKMSGITHLAIATKPKR